MNWALELGYATGTLPFCITMISTKESIRKAGNYVDILTGCLYVGSFFIKVFFSYVLPSWFCLSHCCQYFKRLHTCTYRNRKQDWYFIFPVNFLKNVFFITTDYNRLIDRLPLPIIDRIAKRVRSMNWRKPSVRPSVCLSVCLSIRPAVCPFCPSVCLSLCLSVRSSVRCQQLRLAVAFSWVSHKPLTIQESNLVSL